MNTAVIIDNEDKFIITLKELLKVSYPTLKVVGEAHGVKSGATLILETNPDIVFLDVEMDDGTGFDLLRSVDQKAFKLIFVTAYDQYAVEAFKFSAMDYLLKPLTSKKVASAMEKVQNAQDKERMMNQLAVLLHNMEEQTSPKKKIVLKEADQIHVIKLEDILWCRAEGSYTVFHLADRQIIVSTNLKEYESVLNGNGFFRVHRSHLVNLQKIVRYEKSEGGTVILENNEALPVSVRRKDELTRLLSQL